jgi:hypothetical protein
MILIKFQRFLVPMAVVSQLVSQSELTDFLVAGQHQLEEMFGILP